MFNSMMHRSNGELFFRCHICCIRFATRYELDQHVESEIHKIYASFVAKPVKLKSTVKVLVPAVTQAPDPKVV